MGKKTSNQWDFGELFPAEATRTVLSVSELTTRVKRLLEQQIGRVWVSGEITNLRVQSSGHVYFTLKDAGSQVSCVLFRTEAATVRNLLADGQRVLVEGEVTVYEPRGQYQLRAITVELQGVGALQAAFEKLKLKLQDEGLFAPERKRSIPKFARRIGLVTSPTGAAIRDVLHVIQRRNPALQIVLAPCAVQGTYAAREIAAAIDQLNEYAQQNPLDLILVTRGGGSLEDLWAFNEEVVARAIHRSQLPVVSAIGHEIDFTISDFVADLRAATPSAAAELITEGIFSSCRFVAEISQWLAQRVRQRLEREQRNFSQWQQRLDRSHPRQWLNEKVQRLDDLELSLGRCLRHDLRNHRDRASQWIDRLRRLRPQQLVRQRQELMQAHRERLVEQTRHQLDLLQRDLRAVQSRLRLLSPEQTLARGYSITLDGKTGKVVRKSSEVPVGAMLKTRLHKGALHSRVEPAGE